MLRSSKANREGRQRRLVIVTLLLVFLYLSLPSALANLPPALVPPQVKNSFQPLTASAYSNQSWYKFEKVDGVANSILVYMPHSTFGIANGTFTYGGGSNYQAFSWNFSRTPTIDTCQGSIGQGCLWTEGIGCGCGNDQYNVNPPNRVWHILYADSNMLEIQYNNSKTSSTIQPRDNYTMIFYKGTDWFVWNVQEVITSKYTGWNGLDQAISIEVSSPLVATLGVGGAKVSKSTITDTVNQLWEQQNKEYPFFGITETGQSNDSIYGYPISSNVPYPQTACGGSNNGEMKCSWVPEAGAGNALDNTFTSGWYTSVTYVIYGTYNDNYNYATSSSAETNATNLAKELYYSQFGTQVGYSPWVFPWYCDITAPGGNGAQGCGGGSNTANHGPTTLGNRYSWYAGANINYQMINQSIGPLASYSQYTFNYNTLTNGTGTYQVSTLSNTQHNSSGNLFAVSTVNLPDVSGNFSVYDNKSINYYVSEYNSTITHSTQITSLIYELMLAGPTSGCNAATNEATSYFRQINSTTWDYEYEDFIFGNWVGITVGVFGHSTTTGTAVPGIYFENYANACHQFPYVEVSLINNTSPVSYSSGSYNFAIYVLPHFGNFTSVSQIDAAMTQSVTMETEKEMYTKPMNLANITEPLAFETIPASTQLPYASASSTGYNATMLMPSGTYTQHFLWNQTLSGTLNAVQGSTSFSQSALSGGMQNVTVTWTSSGSAKLLGFSNASLSVSVPIKLSVAESLSQTATFTLSGCSVSPTSISGDGNAHTVTATPSCSLQVSAPAGSTGERYVFAAGATSETFTTCASGTCSEQDYTYYHQYRALLNYEIDGGGTPQAPEVGCTQYGNAFQNTIDKIASMTWCDTLHKVGWTNPLVGASSTQQYVTGSKNISAIGFTSAVTQTLTYHDQYFITNVNSVPLSGEDLGTSTQTSSSSWFDSDEGLTPGSSRINFTLSFGGSLYLEPSQGFYALTNASLSSLTWGSNALSLATSAATQAQVIIPGGLNLQSAQSNGNPTTYSGTNPVDFNGSGTMALLFQSQGGGRGCCSASGGGSETSTNTGMTSSSGLGSATSTTSSIQVPVSSNLNFGITLITIIFIGVFAFQYNRREHRHPAQRYTEIKRKGIAEIKKPKEKKKNESKSKKIKHDSWRTGL